MKSRVVIGFYCAFFLFLSSALVSWAEGEAERTPSLFIPAPLYTFDAVFEGTPVLHDFIIQNKGTAALVVKKVSGG